MLIAVLSFQAAAGSAVAPEPDVRKEFEGYAAEILASDNPWLGAQFRGNLEKALADPALSGAGRVELMAQLGLAQAQAGELERAIATLKEADRRAQELELDPLPTQRLLALAYLRDAETKNCVERHNSECCIYPLKGGAMHTDRAPAEEARRLFTALLERNPDDLEARWLLNVLAMALGDYPDGVDERWRTPPQTFASETAFPAWRDVAPELGVDCLSLAGGVAVEDYDGDGWFDILTSTTDPSGELRYLRNGGDGTFQDRSAEAHVTCQLGGLNVVAGDYDNDGDQDGLVLRGGWLDQDGRFRRSLLQNDGRAYFGDVTRAAGLAVPAYPSQTALWADLDGDGWLDLYVGNESRKYEDAAADYPNQLFRAAGDGTFRDVAGDSRVKNDRFTKGVCAGDYDNDGDLDMYVSNIGPNRLYTNDGRMHFTDEAPQKNMIEPKGRSFACWFFDHDNDGWLDLVVW